MLLERFVVFLGKEFATDATLIGHDGKAKTLLGQSLQTFQCVRQETVILDAEGIAFAVDQGSVSIEKNSGP